MHSNPNNPYIGIYGSVTIVKDYCVNCEMLAFVIDGELKCCGARSEKGIPAKFKREILAEPRRRLPGLDERRQQLEWQEHRCFYCLLRIGSLIQRGNKQIKLRLHWDHQVPYAYSQDNRASNFVASCHVCNGIKYSFCFRTIEEARIYVQEKRTEKGYLP